MFVVTCAGGRLPEFLPTQMLLLPLPVTKVVVPDLHLFFFFLNFLQLLESNATLPLPFLPPSQDSDSRVLLIGVPPRIPPPSSLALCGRSLASPPRRLPPSFAFFPCGPFLAQATDTSTLVAFLRRVFDMKFFRLSFSPFRPFPLAFGCAPDFIWGGGVGGGGWGGVFFCCIFFFSPH